MRADAEAGGVDHAAIQALGVGLQPRLDDIDGVGQGPRKLWISSLHTYKYTYVHTHVHTDTRM